MKKTISTNTAKTTGNKAITHKAVKATEAKAVKAVKAVKPVKTEKKVADKKAEKTVKPVKADKKVKKGAKVSRTMLRHMKYVAGLETRYDETDRQIRKIVERVFFLDSKDMAPIDQHMQFILYRVLKLYQDVLDMIMEFENVRTRTSGGEFLRDDYSGLKGFIFGNDNIEKHVIAREDKKLDKCGTCGKGCKDGKDCTKCPSLKGKKDCARPSALDAVAVKAKAVKTVKTVKNAKGK